jgi:hypothetical protein
MNFLRESDHAWQRRSNGLIGRSRGSRWRPARHRKQSVAVELSENVEQGRPRFRMKGAAEGERRD